jgi:hypothetical protein
MLKSGDRGVYSVAEFTVFCEINELQKRIIGYIFDGKNPGVKKS